MTLVWKYECSSPADAVMKVKLSGMGRSNERIAMGRAAMSKSVPRVMLLIFCIGYRSTYIGCKCKQKQTKQPEH